jgi:tetratricopeptide (TPR) repeat protein
MKNKIFSPTLYRALASLKSLAFGLALLGFVASAPTYAQEDGKDAPKKEVSDKVAEALGGPIKTAKEEKKYDEAIRQIDTLIPTVGKESYDLAVLSLEKAQLLFAKNELQKAIAPLETTLALTDKYNYFDQKVTLDLVLYLAQLWGQEAAAAKGADEQRRVYAKAYSYVRRWLDQSKTPNPDMQQFAASILLSQAQINPDKVDMGLVKQAQIETEKGLRMSVKPKDQFYVLLYATLQQQGDFKRSAEVLELLVKMQPNNKQYWQQLAATYLQLEEPVRAINTIERAQQYGAMNTPKDNYSLVGIYYNIKQFDRAIELLEAGLRNGNIENTLENWGLLAGAYQQIHKEMKAIEALKEAAKRFPKAGSIDFQIASIYYSLDKTQEAYEAVKSAINKGMDKPASAYLLWAYFASEMKKYEEARDAAKKALEADPNNKDAPRLLKAIEEAIRDRDNQKNQPL